MIPHDVTLCVLDTSQQQFMLHSKQASDLLQDLFPTLVDSISKVGNKSFRSEACFVCSMNYCCDHDT